MSNTIVLNPTDESPTDNKPNLEEGLVEALTSAYASILKLQRITSSAYVRWNDSSRAHEFAWLPAGEEMLETKGSEAVILPSSPIYPSINKMMTTLELNPYEREVQYGYPYIIGFIEGQSIRAPLFTIRVEITSDGGKLEIAPSDEQMRFNSLPFRSESDTVALEHALAKLIESTPELPLTITDLQRFCASVSRETGARNNAALDGKLTTPPSQPRSHMPLTIIDAAACFIAPKTSYFLVSDLEKIGEAGEDNVKETALGWILGKRPNEPTSDNFLDNRSVFYPFPSNRSQRRVAHLVDEPQTRITVVQGPPGTGKSLTIANLACHLVATGKRVLITSQKDKALGVVDDLINTLGLAQLPMTLLRQDKESKHELRSRLEQIQKERSADEARRDASEKAGAQRSKTEAYSKAAVELLNTLKAEHFVERAEEQHRSARTLLRRLAASWNLKKELRRANRHAANRSDNLGAALTEIRSRLLSLASEVLGTSAALRVCDAQRNERNELREFAKLLGRDQKNYRNYSVFDKLKEQPDRCLMLLNILPCWIMTPDDVARLFPCQAGLFDVVIIDEASQCDLPSMTPVLYRAKKAVIAGDSKQMQAQRFAFTANQVAAQAWTQNNLGRFGLGAFLNPTSSDLLQLASIRMDEEAFLDEHYRSLPSIIQFSNHTWYGDRLRLMRGPDDKRYGDPDSAPIVLHRVEGEVEPNTQENALEAEALVMWLAEMVQNPGYSNASFGVICLFEQQVRLVSDLVSEHISEEDRLEHQLVVVNPDGFQGDERDVILYSLSFDAKGMTRAQLSARQAEREHIQGMLNVAFTRARDEMHIFYSADIEEFSTASGTGKIRDWLTYCAQESERIHSNQESRPEEEKCQSLFEAEVLTALREKNVKVFSQYPSCGYFIDLVAELNGKRLAIECDGELYHLDEHGQLKAEDIYRQEVLERAGWEVLRIPYRSWRENRSQSIERILDRLRPSEPEEGSAIPDNSIDPALPPQTILLKDNYELSIIEALKSGLWSENMVYTFARQELGYSRLGSRIKQDLNRAVKRLKDRGIIRVEDKEFFLASEEARQAHYSTRNSR